MKLPFPRFLNLMWHLVTLNMKQEDYTKLRRELSERGLRRDGVPVWWDSDNEASASGLAAARAAGLMV